MVLEAVLYRLQTLSESACKLPDDLKEEHPTIRWRDFIRMRNAIAHDYLGETSSEEILDFVKESLPLLQEAMQKHIPDWKALRSSLQD